MLERGKVANLPFSRAIASPPLCFKTLPAIVPRAALPLACFPLPLLPRHVEGILCKHRIRRWHLDQMFVKISGATHCLWRAVDHEGEVLGRLVTKTRDRRAVPKSLKKVMKQHGWPEVIVIDQLWSYGTAQKDPGHGDSRETER